MPPKKKAHYSNISKKGDGPTKLYTDDLISSRVTYNVYDVVFVDDNGESLNPELKSANISFQIGDHISYVELLLKVPEREDQTIVKSGILRIKCSTAQLKLTATDKEKWAKASGYTDPLEYDDIVYEFNADSIVLPNLGSEAMLVPGVLPDFEPIKTYLCTQKKLRLIVFGSTQTKIDFDQIVDHFKIESHANPLMKWFKPAKRQFFQAGNLLPKDERPVYQYKIRYSFFTWLDYLVTHGMAMIMEAEFCVDKYSGLQSTRRKIHVVELDRLGDRAYMIFIPIPEDDESRLAPGDSLRINFDLENDKMMAWTGKVVDPVAFTPVNMVTATMYRPWDKDKKQFKDDRKLAVVSMDPADAVVDSIRDIVADDGVLAYISVTTSDMVYKRELAALEELNKTIGIDSDSLTARDRAYKQVLLSNNFLSLEEIDPYSEICPGVNEPESLLFLGDGQLSAFVNMRKSPAGWHLVHGGPGTGKTTYAAEICKPFMIDEENHQVLAMSTANNGVDSLSERFQTTLLELQKQGNAKPARYVLRLHSLESEKDVYLKDANSQRKIPEGSRPKTYQEPSMDEEAVLNELETAKMLHDHYLQATAPGISGVRDRRVKLLKLSLGYRMLMESGIISGGVLGKEEDFSQFRTSYSQFKKNAEFDGERMQQFRAQAKNLMGFVIQEAAVVCTTPALAGDPFVRGALVMAQVLVGDEFGRITDSGMWPLLAYLQSLVLKIIIFDPYQLRPVHKSSTTTNIFADQLGVSFPARLMGAGLKTSFLSVQYRAVPQIANICNKVTYLKRLSNDSTTTVASRPLAIHVTNINRQLFGRATSVIYFNIETGMTSTTKAGSRYNDAYVAYAINHTEKLVFKAGFAGSVCIITPYQAEYLCILSGLEKLKAKYRDQNFNITVDKIDKLQGEEFDVTIVSTTVTDSPGFLSQLNRLNVGLSRAKHGMYVLGNKEGIDKMKGKGKWLQTFQSELLGYQVHVKESVSSEFYQPGQVDVDGEIEGEDSASMEAVVKQLVQEEAQLNQDFPDMDDVPGHLPELLSNTTKHAIIEKNWEKLLQYLGRFEEDPKSYTAQYIKAELVALYEERRERVKQLAAFELSYNGLPDSNGVYQDKQRPRRVGTIPSSKEPAPGPVPGRDVYDQDAFDEVIYKQIGRHAKRAERKMMKYKMQPTQIIKSSRRAAFIFLAYAEVTRNDEMVNEVRMLLKSVDEDQNQDIELRAAIGKSLLEPLFTKYGQQVADCCFYYVRAIADNANIGTWTMAEYDEKKASQYILSVEGRKQFDELLKARFKDTFDSDLLAREGLGRDFLNNMPSLKSSEQMKTYFQLHSDSNHCLRKGYDYDLLQKVGDLFRTVRTIKPAEYTYVFGNPFYPMNTSQEDLLIIYEGGVKYNRPLAEQVKQAITLIEAGYDCTKENTAIDGSQLFNIPVGNGQDWIAGTGEAQNWNGSDGEAQNWNGSADEAQNWNGSAGEAHNWNGSAFGDGTIIDSYDENGSEEEVSEPVYDNFEEDRGDFGAR